MWKKLSKVCHLILSLFLVLSAISEIDLYLKVLCPPPSVCRPALHLVSANLKKKYNSYHYQIWHAGLLGQ